MRDQASMLRRMMAVSRPADRTPPGPPAFVIGSGKGGVGKSVISVMLAAELAAQGRRVLLVDGNQNLGSLHILLGIRPTVRLEHILHEDVSPTHLIQAVSERLWLLPGDSGAESLYGLGSLERARLHHRLSLLYDDFDAVVIDAAPGLESVVRVSTMRATRLMVITTPEPASLTDGYALIKTVNMQMNALPVDVIVNRVLDEDEGRSAFDKLATATERFLQRGIRYLGSLPEDETMRLAVRDPRRLLNGNHDNPIGRALATIAAERLELPTVAQLVE